MCRPRLLWTRLRLHRQPDRRQRPMPVPPGDRPALPWMRRHAYVSRLAGLRFRTSGRSQSISLLLVTSVRVYHRTPDGRVDSDGEILHEPTVQSCGHRVLCGGTHMGNFEKSFFYMSNLGSRIGFIHTIHEQMSGRAAVSNVPVKLGIPLKAMVVLRCFFACFSAYLQPNHSQYTPFVMKKSR